MFNLCISYHDIAICEYRVTPRIKVFIKIKLDIQLMIL
jgi:hypothetical protein